MATESNSKFWSKTKSIFGKATSGEPVASISSKAAAEEFWPATLGVESKKAARISRTYFIDGFVVPYRTLNSVPNDALKHAKGLAVFTILRDELRPPGVAGSGVVVLRLPNGQWSPPAGILVHADGGHWSNAQVGDAYDCLCLINDNSAVDGFTLPRCTLGDDVANPTPVWMYIKSKGHQVEDASLRGVTLAESKDSNEQFYGVVGLSSKQILTGDVQTPSGPVSEMSEVLKAIESGNHESGKLPASGKNPGDYALEAPKRDGQ